MEKITDSFKGMYQEAMEKWKNTPEEEKQRIRRDAMKPEPSVFVVFEVMEEEWNSHYSKGTYCHMGMADKKVRVGAVIAEKNFDERSAPFPRQMNDDELLHYQKWAEAYNHYPMPFKKQ